MTRLWTSLNPKARAEGGRDDGSIVMAMLGLVIMSSVATIGLATVVNGQKQTRHDNAFAQALTGAESGMDAMVSEIKANPTASSFTALTAANTTTGASYVVTATATSSGWRVDSVGKATTQKDTISREITEDITVTGVYAVPLFGHSALTLGTGSGVSEYDSGSNGSASNSSCGVLPDTGLLGTGLAATTMCQPPSSGTGPAATDGSLTMTGTDVSNFSEVDIDNAKLAGSTDPERTGTCVGDSVACASSRVKTSPQSLTYPASTLCANGIGIDASAITGSNYLAAGAVYKVLGDLTLNAAVVANLNNLSSSGITLCFNGNLIVPSLGAAGVSVPWNSTVNTTLPLTYAPRPPSTLTLIDTATSYGTSTISLGDGLNTETALSAVIYAPYATCSVTGHLDLYGDMVCGSVSANTSVSGASGIDVHYDQQLNSTSSEHVVSVGNWREVH